MGISVVAAELISNPPPTTTPAFRTRRSKDQVSISFLLRQNPHLSLHQLKQIQAQLFHRSLHHDNILITKLIAACSSSGTMDYAARLFHSLPEPDLVLCNSVLRGYTLNSLPRHAILFYLQHVLSRGFLPDRFTYPYVLKACSSLSDSLLGAQIHANLAKVADLCGDVVMLNSLAGMYFKCGKNELASRVFWEIEDPNATSWNIMISGFLSSGDLESAKELFDEMPERDVVSWNTLLSAYAKAGNMEMAQKVFDEIPERNLVSWNGLITGYSQNGEANRALLVFSRMLISGVEPDNTTIVIIVSACSGLHTLEHDVINQVIKCAKLVNSLSVSTALMSLYAKVGRIEEARKIFDRIPEKDLVTWNAMIGGYSQNQRPAEAIGLFRLMQKQEFRLKIEPDGVTMVSLIDSCSQLGALALGEWIHAYIKKNNIKLDVILVTALIDMFAKCGDLNRSRLLFSGMPEKDLPSWNAMIKGLAIHGQGNEAIELFNLMERTGMAPNGITFVGLLSACSHGGLVSKGLEIFDLMQNRYGVVPQIGHYGCVVDILGRAGQVAEAYEFVKRMPIKPDSVVWGTLLDACRSHRNIELAEEAAHRLMELEPGHDGNYVLLSNAYAMAGKWEDVAKIRAQMRANQVQKTPGCSVVELEGVVHEFTAGDRTHPESAEIRAVWDELVKKLKLMGYEPDTGALLKDYEDEEDKEEALYGHSEKLALSFALINSNTVSPAIRIVKNLRICRDCHRTMELVSRLKEREIIVRDRIRFHHFSAGNCSCGGYW